MNQQLRHAPGASHSSPTGDVEDLQWPHYSNAELADYLRAGGGLDTGAWDSASNSERAAMLSGRSADREEADREETVEVRDAKGLTKALKAAKPGQHIQLADGVYEGSFRLRRSGTKRAPIRVSGSRRAILDGGEDTTFTLAGSWVELHGFSIRGGRRGLILDGASNNRMTGLDVSSIQNEAVHMLNDSSDNLLADSRIRDTGRGRPGIGEGVYVGSDSDKWTKKGGKYGGKDGVDRSDNNLILNNWIQGTTAEAVDVKEGTRGTLIQGNVFDGDAIRGENGADSLVDLKGEEAQLRDNVFMDSSGGRSRLKMGWQITQGRYKDSGTTNAIGENRFYDMPGGTQGMDHVQRWWGKGKAPKDKIVKGGDSKGKQPEFSKWKANASGWGRAPEQAEPGAETTPSPKQPSQKRPARNPMGRWDPARLKRRTRLFDAKGEPGRRLSEGQAIWVRTGSEAKAQLGDEEQPSWKIMVDVNGEGSDDKGRVVADALPSRFQPAASGGGGAGEQGGGALDDVRVPATGSAKDKEFPKGIATLLLEETGLDSEQWDNIADLIAKSEQDQEKGWSKDPGEFYGSCEELHYDKAFRGTTITAFGATTGVDKPMDAQRLFKEYGTSAKELGLGDRKRFKKNIQALGTNPKWQQAVWRWFHKEYVAPSVAALEERGFTSALTIAAVTDCALNQGYTGKMGAQATMKKVKGARSEEDFLRGFLDERAKVVDKNDHNAYGNGQRRVNMFQKLLKRGQMDLRDKGAVRDAMSWKMHGPND